MKSITTIQARGIALFLLVLLLTGVTSSIHAASISKTYNWSIETILDSNDDVDNRAEIVSSNQILNIDAFDASLGTLDSVSILFKDTAIVNEFSALFVNPGAGDVGGSAQITQPRFNFEGLSGVTFSRFGFTSPGNCSGGPESAGASCAIMEGPITRNYLDRLFEPTDLGFYTGDDDIEIKITQAFTFSADETKAFNGFVDSRFAKVTSSGQFEVTYEFTAAPVPLPGAAWLFGSALLGLAGLRKKST